MILYTLRCEAGHEFESWFRDSAGFDAQAAGGLVECPVCGTAKVSRALMTPAVARAPGVKGRAEAPVPAEKPTAPKLTAGPMPAQVVALLQRMRADVEKNCDYVGDDFAEEARRIHHGDAKERGIYGEATDAEAEALSDEGIAVNRIPWVPQADG